MSEVLKDFSANIDLKQSLVNEDVKVVEGDNGNVLVLNIVKDGLPVDLTDCLVQIVFAHSGRTVWQDSSSPDGGITISGDDNNIVTVRLHSDSFAPNGITVCQVKIYSGDGQETLVSSSRFSFKAELSLLNAETVESIEQYSILVTLIEACNSVLDRDQADWDETDTTKVSFVRNKPVADIDAHASRHYNGGADPIAPALIGAEAMRMVFDGVTVATTGWATYTPSGDEETAIAALGFTYKKTVTLEDVTADMDIAVDPLSDYYSCGADVCSIAVPTTDGVVLYANAVPASAFTINATAWRAAGDVPGVDETIGAQIIADAAAAVASAESAVSDAVSAKNAAETAQGASEAAQLAAESARDDAEEAVASIPSTHNGFSGLQGGAALERYHMTAEQNTALHAHANKAALDNVTGTNTGDQAASSFNHNDLANKQGGTENEYYHVTAAEKTVIENTSGTNTGDQDVSGAISDHNEDVGAHASLFSAVMAAGTASPAGTYANLAALIAADPDHTKIYITLDDGKWCYHNGSAFVAGRVYQAASVAGDIAGILSTLGYVTDSDYVDIDFQFLKTDEYYSKTNGLIIAGSYYYQSRIEVLPGEKYVLIGTNDYNKAIYATEDINGDVVRYVGTANTTGSETLEVIIESGETNLVLQAKADHRATYSLQKYNGEKIKDEVVRYSALGADVTDLIPVKSLQKNLFDINAVGVTIGKYVNKLGVLTDEATLSVSDYIPIVPNVTYEFPVLGSYFGGSNILYVPYYGLSKGYVSFATGTYDASTKLLTVTFANASARYCRINFPNINSYHVNAINLNPENMMFIKSPYPSEYVPFGEWVISPQNEHFVSEEQQKLNPLYGKSALFLGDSICNGGSAADGLNGWAGRIGRKNKMLWLNKGVSGATFTSGVSGSSGVISDIDVSDAVLYGTPDYIIIEGGTNDADLLGSALSEPPAKFGTYTAGDFTSTFDNMTYCGAIEKLFQAACNGVKSAKIGVIIAHKMGQLNGAITDYTATNNNRRKYFETLIALCKKWGIPYLNLWDESILNPMLANHYTYGQENTVGKYYTDGQHLSSEGYDYVSVVVEAWMKAL